ncbi:hypothetical protein GCM10025789_20390 [Tessaracoccus lubricantis]|uniref:Type I-E CRISPR-associated protein Cas5/CasD n=1 Tax=Tessaracoccus lubricantis TaxID=545543 RepID=A0ABP9FFS8_9ACTN
MSVLRLRLAGPLQSWGASSRFTRRTTESAPTKSGLLGLLAAAQGRRRSDPIEDLLGLELAVRTEQQGVLLSDFQTAHHRIRGTAMPLTYRHYWSDAVFTAHIGGPREVLEGLHEALADPRFPLYFGRRSCVPEGRVALGVFDGSVSDSVRDCQWYPGRTALQKARRSRESAVHLLVQADHSAFPDLPAGQELNDVPISFNPEHRQYRSRAVVNLRVRVETGIDPVPGSTHDPFEAIGGA